MTLREYYTAHLPYLPVPSVFRHVAPLGQPDGTDDSAMNAWEFANHIARETQYRIAFADGLIANKPTTSKSADSAGTGAVPPPATVGRTDA